MGSLSKKSVLELSRRKKSSRRGKKSLPSSSLFEREKSSSRGPSHKELSQKRSFERRFLFLLGRNLSRGASLLSLSREKRLSLRSLSLGRKPPSNPFSSRGKKLFSSEMSISQALLERGENHLF